MELIFLTGVLPEPQHRGGGVQCQGQGLDHSCVTMATAVQKTHSPAFPLTSGVTFTKLLGLSEPHFYVEKADEGLALCG